MGLITVLGLLTAGRLPLQPARQVLLPRETNPPIGAEFTVKVGEPVVVSKFMSWNIARLEKSTSVSIDRFSQEIGAEMDLEAFGSTPASSKRTGLSANRYFCGKEIKAHSDLSYQLLTSVTSNVEQFVRFCLADEDGDEKLDHVFLGGAKSRDLQGARAIEPVPFHTLELQPDKDDKQFPLILQRIDPKNHSLLFYLRPQRDGQQIASGSFSLFGASSGIEYPHRDKINIQYSLENPTEISNILGYDLLVTSVDVEKNQVTFILKHTAVPMLYQSTEPNYYMIFIYI